MTVKNPFKRPTPEPPRKTRGIDDVIGGDDACTHLWTRLLSDRISYNGHDEIMAGFGQASECLTCKRVWVWMAVYE